MVNITIKIVLHKSTARAYLVAADERKTGGSKLMHHNAPGLEMAGQYKNAGAFDELRQLGRLYKPEMHNFRMFHRRNIAGAKAPQFPIVGLLFLQFDKCLPKIGNSFKVVIAADVNKTFREFFFFFICICKVLLMKKIMIAAVETGQHLVFFKTEPYCIFFLRRPGHPAMAEMV